MKNLPIVSILINNYNYANFLNASIDSALNQTYPHVEVVVVDDGSTDDSHEILESYGSRISTVLKKNGGQASAFNAGIEASKGALIFFLDADDIFYPQKVEEIVDLLDSININNPLIIFHMLEAVDEHRLPLDFILPGGANKELHESRVNRRTDNPLIEVSSPGSAYEYAAKYRYIPYLCSPTSGLIITRSLAKQLFPLPQEGITTCADDFIVKPAALLGNVYRLDLVLGQYRIHGKNGWYNVKKPQSQLFLGALDEFLNSKLGQEKQPIFSYLESMIARDYYRDHYGYVGCHTQLIKIAFKVILHHTDLRTCRFFIKTIFIAIKSYLYLSSRSSSFSVSNDSK